MLMVKNSSANAREIREVGLITGLGRSLGGKNYTLLQYFAEIILWTEEPGGLYTVHGVAKSWTRLSMHHTHMNLD